MSDDVVKKALELLKDAPDVPPDPGDEMPADDTRFRSFVEFVVKFAPGFSERERAWFERYLVRQALRASELVLEARHGISPLPDAKLGMPRPGDEDYVQPERVATDLVKVSRLAYADGLERGRRQGANHALIRNAEERVVAFAEDRFGEGAELWLLLDGDLQIVITDAKSDARKRQSSAFASDLERCIPIRGITIYLHDERTDILTFYPHAFDGARQLKGSSK